MEMRTPAKGRAGQSASALARTEPGVPREAPVAAGWGWLPDPHRGEGARPGRLSKAHLTHMLLKRNKSSHVKARSVVITPPPPQPARLNRAPAAPEVAQRASRRPLLPGHQLFGKPCRDAAPSGGQSQELPGHLRKVTDE